MGSGKLRNQPTGGGHLRYPHIDQAVVVSALGVATFALREGLLPLPPHVVEEVLAGHVLDACRLAILDERSDVTAVGCKCVVGAPQGFEVGKVCLQRLG